MTVRRLLTRYAKAKVAYWCHSARLFWHRLQTVVLWVTGTLMELLRRLR